MVNFIEFPIFDGVSGDLRAWISWLEDFFVRERFTEDEKMNLAQSLLEGEANAWFYSSRKRFAFQSWEHLVVELLIWRFGDFGDGGVFSDLELFLLWNKYDRILRKRRKRMTTTSIPEKNLNLTASRETTDSTLATKSIQEAISESVLDGDASIEKDESYEATMVKVEDDTTMFQVSDSLEEESIHQNQVPVASVEPSLSFSCESLVVSDARQSEIVSNNWVHSQSVLECVKNKATAYQVFDKTSLHKERLKPRNKRKLSLSLKTWMFKFKNKLLHRNKSTNRILAELNFDAVNVSTSQSNKSSDPSSFVIRVRDYSKYGTVIKTDLGKEENGEDLELLLEILTKITVTEEPSFHGLWEPKPEPDIASETDSRRMTLLTMKFPENLVDLALDKFGKDTSIDEMVAFIVAAQLAEISAKEVICAWAECMMHTTIVISAKLYSLFSCEVDTNENMSSGLSQTRQVWEPGGVLAAHLLVDWLVDFHDSAGIVDGIRCLAIGVCSGIQQPIDSRRASRVWERGGVDIILGMHWLETLGTCVVVGMQLIVVCMLHSWRVCILFTNSWERKFCKDWWFKFKSNIRIGEAL